MRILYVTDLTLDDRSAPAVHVDEICRNLGKLGHAVTLYAPSGGTLKEQGYVWVRIPAPRVLRSLFFQPRLFVVLMRAIRNERPNVLYIRHSQLLVVPMMLARWFRIPAILEVNGILEQDATYVEETLLSKALMRTGVFAFLERFNARRATRIVAVSEGIKEYFVREFGTRQENIAVIHNGVDTEKFAPLPQGGRGALGLEEGALYLGYIGSLHSWQGLRYMVEAVKILHIKYPHMRLLIVGEGSEAAYIREYIVREKLENVVELRGAVAHEEVPVYMNALDICLIYPLRLRDGATSPFKVYEYLACGKPVVAADLVSLRAEFGDVLTYAKAESTEALAAAIASLLNEAAVRKARGLLGRAFIDEGHSWEAVTQQILSVCRQCEP